ncbi:unnamed protein product [Pleuronectes platessa]|uniref:Uncharacterized protein n=1 Tax=Pleuronectes platessa TaxID=8262 RepID=A0A9N7YFY3_PLEPL|nr:unnamed protein product [Pleuronectes platessa]
MNLQGSFIEVVKSFLSVAHRSHSLWRRQELTIKMQKESGVRLSCTDIHYRGVAWRSETSSPKGCDSGLEPSRVVGRFNSPSLETLEFLTRRCFILTAHPSPPNTEDDTT